MNHDLPKTHPPLLLTFLPTPRQEPSVGTILGNDSRTLIVEDHTTKHIISYDPTQQLPQRFINASTAHLARCLQAHNTFLSHQNPQTLRQDLTAIDPQATATPEHWWSIILEQIEDGLL